MSISKNQAQVYIKNLYGEAFSLTPSALIVLFEIDITDILMAEGVISDLSGNESSRIFRFHNNIPLVNTSIWWQNKEYIAVPVRAEGFETNSRGTLPTPRLGISVSSEGISALALLKDQMYKVADIAGAKVTRIRTLAKYLDPKNFVDGVNNNVGVSQTEFPRDIYYVDRKSSESKNSIEFELASVLDVEGIKLPNRVVVANRCIWSYRGEGCMYEANQNRNEKVHGLAQVNGAPYAKLPASAPPVATENDETFDELLPGTSLVAKGAWKRGETYRKGEYVYVEKDGIKYYFVAKFNHTSPNICPPNPVYWYADCCSKQIKGCRLRWGKVGNKESWGYKSNILNGAIPFGGFPATSKLQ